VGCALGRRAVAIAAAFLAFPPGASAEPTLYRFDCQTASPRIPGIFSALPWSAELPLHEHVFGGEALPSTPVDDEPSDADPSEESRAWPVTGGIWLTLREIDLDADGRCDLVGTAKVAISTGGDSTSNLVFWFSTPDGWRRDGATTTHEFNPMSLELLSPQSPEDHARFGFGTYLPARLDDGRVVLAARRSSGRMRVDRGPVTLLAFDAKRGAMAPFSDTRQAARLAALAERVCEEEESEDEACVSWFE
jgi:hypothetical protein